MNQMLFLKEIIIIIFILILVGCSQNYPLLETVDIVDLKRYAGVWYEIARAPNRFQKNCFCTTAEYSILDNTSIRVVNKCFKQDTKEIKSVKGKAFIVEGSGNAKLKVQFFWPFRGDYWILKLDKENYSYAIVGTPDRKYFWILSRTPDIPQQKLNDFLSFLSDKQFDTTSVIITNRQCSE